MTHMFDLAEGFRRQRPGGARFLRADRGVDGMRTFRLVEGDPLPTSYGIDTYRRVFAEAPHAPRAAIAQARR